ncbi:MAG: ABC transporter permease subunit [Coprococcus sp.]|nr:ABC transporter permease subunit [Coprococcus sp.]
MLIRYEFLKILRKSSTLIIMAVSLLLTTFLFGLPVMQFQTYNEDGAIKGADGIAYEKERYLEVSVPLSEEYITETIFQVQKLFEVKENVGYDGSERFLIGDAYWEEIAPKEKLLNMIAKVYDKPNENSGYQKLADLDAAAGADFYKTMESKIDAILDGPSRALSNEQKKYWRGMARKVDTPLQYGYYEGWEIILSSMELLMFAVLSVCIVIAPVFSGEYQAGTDAVILSGRYGKTKLITAKIIASFLFGGIAFTLHVMIAWGLPLAAFGTDGWNLPVQIANPSIPYPFTFLKAAVFSIGVVFLVLAAMIGLTLLLSSKMKTPYLVLAVLVPILFIPMFLTPTGTTGIYNKILFLLPYRAVMPEIGKYISYQFGGLIMDAFSVRGVLYAVLTGLMIPVARKGFKKHQVM